MPPARGHVVLTDETERQFGDLSQRPDLEDRLVEAIRRKLPTASSGGELLIEASDIDVEDGEDQHSGTKT